MRCTKLHYSKVLPSTFKISSTETSFYNTLNGTTGGKRRQARSTRGALDMARLQPSCVSLTPRPLSALWKTLQIALVLQATKNFHNNWRSGLLRRRELPKNKQANGLNARTILITALVVHSTAEIMFTFINQFTCYLTISSCISVRMSRYWARGKFGEHERGVRVARGAAECNSSLLSALQTSQVLNISTYARWRMN